MYRNIPQSIASSCLTYLLVCLGYFHNIMSRKGIKPDKRRCEEQRGGVERGWREDKERESEGQIKGGEGER